MRICTQTVYSGYAVMCQHNAAAEKHGCLNTFGGAGARWPRRSGEGGVRTKDDGWTRDRLVDVPATNIPRSIVHLCTGSAVPIHRGDTRDHHS